MSTHAIPRHRLRLYTLALAAAFASASCTTSDASSPTDTDEPLGPTEATTGLLTVWTSDSSPSPIEVTVDGVAIGTLTKYWSSAPACGSSQSGATLTITTSAGSHIVSAEETRGTKYWPATTVRVTGGGCLSFALNP
jgi:hypothetical protein